MDIETTDHGTLIGFEPKSDLGADWIAENLPDDAPRLGRTVYAERRCAPAIIDGMIDDGLDVVSG
jgi:hypothetical protein